MTIGLILSFGAVLATFCILFFLYELFKNKQEERKEKEKNKDFDFTEFNKQRFGDL